MARLITLITTGGTIEKTYDEASGVLANRRSIVRRMLQRLRLEETQVNILEIMSKDSLLMTDEDREKILTVVRAALSGSKETMPVGLVILHGTDTLALTGERLHSAFGPGGPPVPIVLTGAMRPFEMVRSDALQNLTEALFAAGTLPAGVYAAVHGRALAFPGVQKDRDRGTFVRV